MVVLFCAWCSVALFGHVDVGLMPQVVAVSLRFPVRFVDMSSLRVEWCTFLLRRVSGCDLRWGRLGTGVHARQWYRLGRGLNRIGVIVQYVLLSAY